MTEKTRENHQSPLEISRTMATATMMSAAMFIANRRHYQSGKKGGWAGCEDQDDQANGGDRLHCHQRRSLPPGTAVGEPTHSRDKNDHNQLEQGQHYHDNSHNVPSKTLRPRPTHLLGPLLETRV